MNKNKAAAVILGIVIAAGAGICWHMSHGISLFARVDLGDKNTNTHSKADIREAVSIVRKEFRDFEGCIMTELSYSEELTQSNLTVFPNGIYEDYDDIIVLNSAFTVSKLQAGLWDSTRQSGWTWTLLHNAENGWYYYGCGRG